MYYDYHQCNKIAKMSGYLKRRGIYLVISRSQERNWFTVLENPCARFCISRWKTRKLIAFAQDRCSFTFWSWQIPSLQWESNCVSEKILWLVLHSNAAYLSTIKLPNNSIENVLMFMALYLQVKSSVVVSAFKVRIHIVCRTEDMLDAPFLTSQSNN